MKILKHLIENGGNFTSDMLPEFVANFPDMPVVIKFEQKPRKIVTIKDLENEMKLAERTGDYAREVFISSDNFRRLAAVFGMSY